MSSPIKCHAVQFTPFQKANLLSYVFEQEFGQMFWLPLSYFLYWSPSLGPCQCKQKLLWADEFYGEKEQHHESYTKCIDLFSHSHC